jgi:hypothetical protein
MSKHLDALDRIFGEVEDLLADHQTSSEWAEGSCEPRSVRDLLPIISVPRGGISYVAPPDFNATPSNFNENENIDFEVVGCESYTLSRGVCPEAANMDLGDGCHTGSRTLQTDCG